MLYLFQSNYNVSIWFYFMRNFYWRRLLRRGSKSWRDSRQRRFHATDAKGVYLKRYLYSSLFVVRAATPQRISEINIFHFLPLNHDPDISTAANSLFCTLSRSSTRFALENHRADDRRYWRFRFGAHSFQLLGSTRCAKTWSATQFHSTKIKIHQTNCQKIFFLHIDIFDFLQSLLSNLNYYFFVWCFLFFRLCSRHPSDQDSSRCISESSTAWSIGQVRWLASRAIDPHSRPNGQIPICIVRFSGWRYLGCDSFVFGSTSRISLDSDDAHVNSNQSMQIRLVQFDEIS
jgi:hypothetical protein